tara:strand:- start:275 stop:1459 length:1185 start_codon:yes stop_codon:yes gene_type:complete
MDSTTASAIAEATTIHSPSASPSAFSASLNRLSMSQHNYIDDNMLDQILERTTLRAIEQMEIFHQAPDLDQLNNLNKDLAVSSEEKDKIIEEKDKQISDLTEAIRKMGEEANDIKRKYTQVIEDKNKKYNDLEKEYQLTISQLNESGKELADSQSDCAELTGGLEDLKTQYDDAVKILVEKKDKEFYNVCSTAYMLQSALYTILSSPISKKFISISQDQNSIVDGKVIECINNKGYLILVDFIIGNKSFAFHEFYFHYLKRKHQSTLKENSIIISNDEDEDNEGDETNSNISSSSEEETPTIDKEYEYKFVKGIKDLEDLRKMVLFLPISFCDFIPNIGDLVKVKLFNNPVVKKGSPENTICSLKTEFQNNSTATVNIGELSDDEIDEESDTEA